MKFATTWRGPRALVAAASGLAIAAASLTVAAPAANAAGSLTGPSTAGVSQSVTVNLAGAPAGLVDLTDTNTGQEVSSATAGLGDQTLSFYFTTPSSPTTLNLVAYQNGSQVSSNNLIISVGGIGTTTTISAPNTTKVGTSTKITATVTSLNGSQYSPPGQVVIKDATGATLQTMGLTNGPGAGQSYAYWRWTPTTAGTYFFTATYVPAGGSQATGSTSAQDAISATASGGVISLTAPPTMTQNVPVTLTASIVPANTQGTVGFTLNGAPISAAIPIVNGVATFQWTPNVVGQVTLGASYTTNAGGSGSTTDVVTISGAPAQSDQITLIQPGWGAWAPNGTYPMGNGSTFTFQASTLSGAPVTLGITGPCTVTGLTLQVNQGNGQCNMTASSPGGNGYAPVTYGYTLSLVPGIQTADVSAPPSGRFKVGRVLVLESPGKADTNAGQNIGWKIKKKGRKFCKLLYPDNGSVTLRITGKGECTVVGTAPGVAGEWQPFKTTRKYRGR